MMKRSRKYKQQCRNLRMQGIGLVFQKGHFSDEATFSYKMSIVTNGHHQMCQPTMCCWVKSSPAHQKGMVTRFIFNGIRFRMVLLNTLFAWNASTLEVTHRKRLLRHEMMSVIAQYMMNFRDLTIIASPQLMSGRTNVQDVDGENHVPVVVSSNNRCVVCRLEHIMDEKIGGRGMTRCVARCVRCGVLAHPYMPTDSNREIHKLECFQGMSCFQIAHSKEGRDIWKESFQRKRKQFSINKKNPIVIKLQRLHGFEAAIRDSRKRKKIADEDSSDTSDNNSNDDDGSTNNDS